MTREKIRRLREAAETSKEKNTGPWWKVERSKARGYGDAPLYFQHSGRPYQAHEDAGKAIGLPSGYGYTVTIQDPPADRVAACTVDGTNYFCRRPKFCA